ncbi:MAG: cytochrome c [Gammaproteobacteria bacterium]|nr:cytochrome c [Gammaproteobacteria bacterium]
MTGRGLATLLLCGSLTACGGAPDSTAATAPGERLYALHCSACHQRDGRGIEGVQPALAGAPTVAGDLQPLIRWVLFGERPPALVSQRRASVMPVFGWLSDDEVAAILTHVRGAFGNGSTPVTAAMVGAERRLRH